MNTIILGWLDFSDVTAEKARDITKILSEQRRRKAETEKTDIGLVRSACAGYLSETMLREVGVVDFRYTFSANGKPSVNGVHYNLSHSGNFVVCAVAPVPVGCDVERLRPLRGNAYQRALSEKEKQYVDGDASKFYRIWTIKESYIKLTGGSVFSTRPDSVEVMFTGDEPMIFGSDARFFTGKINEYLYSISFCGQSSLLVNNYCLN